VTESKSVLHCNGPVIAGGMAYSVAELAALPAQATHSSGLGPIDSLTMGGLPPGAIWTVVGPPALGVTAVVIQAAVHAARTARVGIANGHMATHLLREQILAAASLTETDRAAADRIEIASWIPVPDFRCDETSWFGAAFDVLVIDCLDEMFHPGAWPDADSAIRSARWLREMARRTNTALVLTGRAERMCSAGREAFESAWQRNWARPVFDDVADLSLEFWFDDHGDVAFHASARGRGQTGGHVHRRADRSLILHAQ
jgi:predicted ATP-dependent serine protease